MSVRSLLRILGLVLVGCLMSAQPVYAQKMESALQGLLDSVDGLGSTSTVTDGVDVGDGAETNISSAVEIAVLLTALSLLPAILISITSFTRIVIVLSFVRKALSINELPPNPVLVGLALFLTSFVMAPIAGRVYEKAWEPYQQGEIEAMPAAELAWGELRTFLIANTRESELQLFAEMNNYKMDRDIDELKENPLPLTVVVPAFVLSELKTAFQMGFLLFLPFLVIDLVISSILLSMGMFMLPPVMISTPFKVLVFVLVDGWHLICQSVVTSFIV
jgi:flagellar biosynthesis protein FliP